jgi:hypothetical protein
VLVVGDSVALTLGRGIERWGVRRDVTVMNAAKLGCSLLDGARVRGYWGVQTRPADSCHTESEWPALLERFRPDVVVAMFGAWDVYEASWDGRTWHAPGDAEWNARYAARVEAAAKRLQASGAEVVWLAPPCFQAPPGSPDAAAGWYAPARVDAIRDVYRTAAAPLSVHVNDIAHRAGCPVDLQTRPDGVHYSDPGADVVAAQLGPAFERTITG